MKLFQRLVTESPLIHEPSFANIVSQYSSTMTALLTQPQGAEPPYLKEMRGKLKPQASTTDDGIRVIPIEGTLARKPDVWEMFYGFEDTNNVIEMLEAAEGDNGVKAVVAVIDSPGGFMTGGAEAAQILEAIGTRKPTVAFSSGMMASLAYMIGSKAKRIVASQTAVVGSIGVYTTHLDWTKAMDEKGVKVEVIKNKEAVFKAAGVMGTALTEEQRANIQERIQSTFNEFKASILSARHVRSEAMQGQVYHGAAAREVGLIDAIGSQRSAIALARAMIRN